MASVLIPLVAVLCIAVVGVLSFTNVRDRQSEIGIFRAMGVTAGRILQVFLARAFLSGFLGSILGLGLLYFLGDTYKETHFFGYALEQLVDSQLLLQSLIFVPVLACLAAWLPSLRLRAVIPLRFCAMSEAILDCKGLRKVFSNNGAEVEALGGDHLIGEPRRIYWSVWSKRLR